jgi:hypothetical protein
VDFLVAEHQDIDVAKLVERNRFIEVRSSAVS